MNCIVRDISKTHADEFPEVISGADGVVDQLHANGWYFNIEMVFKNDTKKFCCWSIPAASFERKKAVELVRKRAKTWGAKCVYIYAASPPMTPEAKRVMAEWMAENRDRDSVSKI